MLQNDVNASEVNAFSVQVNKIDLFLSRFLLSYKKNSNEKF